MYNNKSTIQRIIITVFIVFIFLGIVGCSSTSQKTVEKNDTLTQVSLLNALMQGDYDGTVTIEALKKAGDIGIGTFDKLDGELVMLDGQVYKAKADGTVELQADSGTVPFAVTTGFDSEIQRDFSNITGIEDIKTILDKLILEETGDFNSFYIGRIEGAFDFIHVRSVPAQSKPYRPLSEITADQVEFRYDKIEGTIIALRCPDYAEGMNLPGWHLHFISADKTKGGHLLDVRAASVSTALDRTLSYSLKLPGTDNFAKLNLGAEADKKTTEVEGKK